MKFAYAPNHFLQEIIGLDGKLVARNEYDDAGNKVQCHYNTQGKITQNENALGQIIQYTYDQDGNLYSHTDPLGNTSLYNYNEEGKCTSIVSIRTNAKGEVEQVIRHTIYDELGRIVEVVGEQFDQETALYYLRARYMDSTTGRFISMDTYSGDMRSPITQHK